MPEPSSGFRNKIDPPPGQANISNLMKFRHCVFVLLIGAGIWLGVSDDARRYMTGRAQAFVEKYYRLRRPSDGVPMAVTKLANERGIDIETASGQLNKVLEHAPRLLIEGTLLEQLPTGHLLVNAKVSSGSTVLANLQAVALYGYPMSTKVAVGASVRCDVQSTGLHQFALKDGRVMRIEELIYAGEHTKWMFESGRTSLDKPR